MYTLQTLTLWSSHDSSGRRFRRISHTANRLEGTNAPHDGVPHNPVYQSEAISEACFGLQHILDGAELGSTLGKHRLHRFPHRNAYPQLVAHDIDMIDAPNSNVTPVTGLQYTWHFSGFRVNPQRANSSANCCSFRVRPTLRPCHIMISSTKATSPTLKPSKPNDPGCHLCVLATSLRTQSMTVEKTCGLSTLPCRIPLSMARTLEPQGDCSTAEVSKNKTLQALNSPPGPTFVYRRSRKASLFKQSRALRPARAHSAIQLLTGGYWMVKT